MTPGCMSVGCKGACIEGAYRCQMSDVYMSVYIVTTVCSGPCKEGTICRVM